MLFLSDIYSLVNSCIHNIWIILSFAKCRRKIKDFAFSDIFPYILIVNFRKLIFMKIIYILLIIFISHFAEAQSINIGDEFIDFTLPYATQDTIIHQGIQLSDLIGKKGVVLAFYPADWSSGCTKQLCAFRDNFAMLEKLDAEILAISGDYVWSHHFWAKHQNYQFKLLSDHDHSVAKKYNSYNPERGYNKRTVFVIDKQGKIAYIDWKYGVADDVSFNNLKNALSNLIDIK